MVSVREAGLMPMREGQTLWYVPADMRWSKPREVTVTKIGRKWATLGNFGRVDITTMYVDGGDYPSPGRCYLSKEDYEVALSADRLWRKLVEKIGYKNRPMDVFADAIRQAAALLGVDLGDGA